jgi:hypothetical protein
VNDSAADRERKAKNEALFRQVNERVKEVSDAFAELDPSPIDFVCECSDENCARPVSLTMAEYERVRGVPTHFVVVPEHVVPDIESVVREGDGHVVVEKASGPDEVAVETDPRS